MSDVKPDSVAAQRSGGPYPAPRRAGDEIIFYCPNGDRIVVSAALGGKTGLCTKCKVKVVIPALGPVPDRSEPPVAAASQGLAPAQPAAVHSAPSTPPASAADGMPTDADVPPPLQGPVPAAEPPAPVEQVDWDLVAGQSVAAVDPELAELDVTGPAESGGSVVPGPDHHPAARLVARLWQERAHGGIIELHLAGGSVILPEWYEVNWSRGTHGLFASQAADGTVTMTAVAWDTLEKIVVRQVRDLPQGFE